MRILTILQLVPFMFVIFQLFHPVAASETTGIVQCFYCSATKANGMCKGHSYDAFGPCSGFCLKIALHTDRDGIDVAAASSNVNSKISSGPQHFVNSTKIMAINFSNTTSKPLASTTTTLEHMMEWLSDHSSSSELAAPTTPTSLLKSNLLVPMLSKTPQPASPSTTEEDTELQLSKVSVGGYVFDAEQQRAQFRSFSQFIHNELNDRISLSYVCGCDDIDYCNGSAAKFLSGLCLAMFVSISLLWRVKIS